MKALLAKVHMEVAYRYASISSCIRRKVGCIIVKNDKVISIGVNGTFPGSCNVCEDELGNTKPDVIHAEANAIAKLARTSGDGSGASVFVTCMPCKECAKQLATMNIKELFYSEEYHNTDGVDFLVNTAKIPVYRLPVTFTETKGNTACPSKNKHPFKTWSLSRIANGLQTTLKSLRAWFRS